MKTAMFVSVKVSNLTVALYSVEQDCFHIEKLHEYIHTNVTTSFMGSREAGYKMIGIFNNDIEADTYIETFKSFLKKSND